VFQKRNEVVEGIYITVGDEEDFMPKSWNLVAVDSDYENVPEFEKANLKLSRVAQNAKIR